MLEAQQADNKTVPARLGEHTLTGINHHHRQVTCGSTRRHVSGVLLMARAIGNDELSLVGGEIPIGHINGYALLPFGSQAIHQQGKIQRFAGIALPLAILVQGCEVILKNQLGIE